MYPFPPSSSVFPSHPSVTSSPRSPNILPPFYSYPLLNNSSIPSFLSPSTLLPSPVRPSSSKPLPSLPPSSSILSIPTVLSSLLSQSSLLSEIEEGKLSKLKNQLTSLSSSSSSIHPFSLTPSIQLITSLLNTRKDFESLVGPFLGYLELKANELKQLEGILTADRDFEGKFKDLKRNCLEILHFLKKSRREQLFGKANNINEVIGGKINF